MADVTVTMVFSIPLETWKAGNPFKVETPWGKPEAVALGDILDRANELEEKLDALPPAHAQDATGCEWPACDLALARCKTFRAGVGCTKPVSDGPITREEMIDLFGDAAPIEAINLVWNTPPQMTLREIRKQLRVIAASRTPAEGASVGADEIRNCYDEYCRQNPNDVTWMTPTGVMIRAILQKFDVRPK